MAIQDLSLKEIEANIENYRKRGLSEGGKYLLAELVLELKRRAPSKFSGAEVVNGILNLASESRSGFVTYGELYKCISGCLPWKGNATQREMGLALERGIYHCVYNSLPILTVLVVRQSGELSPEAIQRIYEECKELGVDVGSSPELFIENQLERCREFIKSQHKVPTTLLEPSFKLN